MNKEAFLYGVETFCRQDPARGLKMAQALNVHPVQLCEALWLRKQALTGEEEVTDPREQMVQAKDEYDAANAVGPAITEYDPADRAAANYSQDHPFLSALKNPVTQGIGAGIGTAGLIYTVHRLLAKKGTRKRADFAGEVTDRLDPDEAERLLQQMSHGGGTGRDPLDVKTENIDKMRRQTFSSDIQGGLGSYDRNKANPASPTVEGPPMPGWLENPMANLRQFHAQNPYAAPVAAGIGTAGLIYAITRLLAKKQGKSKKQVAA